MQLREKGQFYELPIKGMKIQSIIYDGLLRIVFNDAESSYLDFHGEFEIIKFNHQKEILFAKDKEALILFYDLFNKAINEAKADKFGRLFITFENGFNLIVEDGPFENWYYTKINKKNPTQSLHVHGGVGKTIF